MATVIRFKVDGINDEMIVPSVNFGLIPLRMCQIQHRK